MAVTTGALDCARADRHAGRIGGFLSLVGAILSFATSGEGDAPAARNGLVGWRKTAFHADFEIGFSTLGREIDCQYPA